MALIDIQVRNYLYTYIIPFVGVILIILIVLTDSWKKIRKRVHAWVIKDFIGIREASISDVKSALFADLGEIESRVLSLRNKGVIRILEIGIGSGTNIKYYPQQSRLVVVDPLSYFQQYYKENKNSFPNVTMEKFIVSNAENMKGVQTSSVDVVVTTFVLCSVRTVQGVLEEIKRILVPGGRYYFLEHELTGAQEMRWVRRFQKLLTWTSLWPWLCNGCKFVPITKEIMKSNFSKTDWKQFQMDISSATSRKTKLVSQIMRSHVVGVAYK